MKRVNQPVAAELAERKEALDGKTWLEVIEEGVRSFEAQAQKKEKP